jgi:soluble lytic murein transglycosylase-like protein
MSLRLILLFICAALPLAAARAQTVITATAAPPAAVGPEAASCTLAGAAAEQAAALPANMLVSIGMIESGRADPLTGKIQPWPWTVNADGAGHYFDSKDDAIAFTRLAESSGAQDVDVGCFQISLQNHPDAFASLDAAFDPAANANYAALYLSELKAQTGSWNAAIADYHSADPTYGVPYQERVLAAWHGIGSVPGTLGSAGLVFPAPDPVVIKLAPAARLVHVYAMDAYFAAPARPGLPRVITP